MGKMNGPGARSLSLGDRKEDAVFIGWQKTSSGDVVALYRITLTGHPSLGSTVSDGTLHKLNLRVPVAPGLQGSVKKT